jgi:glutamate-1-semialdehyde aminotransferase
MQKLNHQRSEALYRRSARVLPGGVPGIRAPENFIPGEYPIFLERGHAGRVVDVDGNEYVDLLCAYGPVIIGHAEPEIDEAVKEQLDAGFCFSLPQVWQTKLMERIVALVPSAEMGIPLKTGSDATSAAVRIARAYTGRSEVMRCGYHGWHDWCVEGGAGVPASHQEHTHAFRYNDLDQLEKLLARHQSQVAAIVVTPIGHDFGSQLEPPSPGFLEGLRALADQHAIVLVFDEIRTGFRVSNGGAQELYGVTPDLTALGKAMANGYAVAAVVGREAVMQTAQETFISSTYFPNSLEMVAACRTLDMITREDVVQRVAARGERLRTATQELLDRYDAPATASPYPQMPLIHFDPARDEMAESWREPFYRELIRAGVFAHPIHHGFLAYRHTDEDLARVTQAIEDGLIACKRMSPGMA